MYIHYSMTTTYTKSLSSDFGGDLEERQLHNEILAELSNISSVGKTGDIVDIIFDSALSSGEQTTLDTIISNHVPISNKSYNKFFTIIPKNNEISNTTYTNIGNFKYDGSDNIGLINYIEIISYKNSNIDSYDIRIIDKSNANVLASATFTNDIPEINDLGNISNIPTQKTILEIQGKQTGGTNKKYLYVDSVNVYYGN